MPDKIVEIGFSTYGPILNLRLSINVGNKDTILSYVGTDVSHQEGDKHQLAWAGMTETFSEITNGKGDNQLVQRNYTPIAIKLGTSILTERFYRFQDKKFILENKLKVEKLIY